MGAMELDTPPLKEISQDTHYITSPSVAPEMCMSLIKALHNQPLFTGTGSIVKKCQALPLGDIDSRIVEVLYKNVIAKLGKYPTVHSFGGGTDQLFDVTGNCLGDGITQWLYDDTFFQNNEVNIKEAFASGHFKKTCDDVIGDMLGGWKQSTLAENPSIFGTRSETEWVLFMKPRKLINEDLLIKLFFSVVGVRDVAGCDCAYLKKNGGYEFLDKLYLWIKKDSFNDVVSKLGLCIKQ